MTSKNKIISTKYVIEKAKKVLKNVTVEPLMLLDGLAFSNMVVFIEDLQMRRICEVKLHQNSSVCDNLSNYSDVSNDVQVNFSVFAFYDGILKSAIPLFFILFMGAWSDKYGRKVPLFIVQLGHVLNMLGFLIFTMVKSWPVEYMLIPTLLDSFGGGNVCFYTAINAYVSDITSESSRTSRVGLANSINFLGGPIGTLMGKFIYQYGGYTAVFSTSLGMSLLALFYVMFFIEESHGPYASPLFRANNKKTSLDLRESVAQIYGIEHKSKIQTQMDNDLKKITLGRMILDFINPQRIIDSFKCTLKPREGNTRILILLVIFCNSLRRLSRSPYVYAFTRYVLSWEVADYSLWVTYKNLMTAVGSLVAVPLLSGRLHVTDHLLGVIGGFSGLLEYVLYAMVVFAGEIFFWIAPIFALLINSCTIAQRAMLTKFVLSDEVGKVSAVLGALDGVMPMINYSLFMAVYGQTVTTYPAAHFYVGAACSGLMILVFLIIMAMDRTKNYDIEKAITSGPCNDLIVSKRILIRNDSLWLSTDQVAMSIITPVFEAQFLPKMEATDKMISISGKEKSPQQDI